MRVMMAPLESRRQLTVFVVVEPKTVASLQHAQGFVNLLGMFPGAIDGVLDGVTDTRGMDVFRFGLIAEGRSKQKRLECDKITPV